jgi:hypothetical protein
MGKVEFTKAAQADQNKVCITKASVESVEWTAGDKTANVILVSGRVVGVAGSYADTVTAIYA